MDKKIKVVMFDLDGTLLPLDQDVFIKTYFGLLAKKMADHGYEPKSLMENIWKCTYIMIKNDGKCNNEAAFWNGFSKIYGEECLKDIPIFDAFYSNEFLAVKDVCGFSPKAAEAVHALKDKGCRVVLATNPLFPAVATHNRCRWAGLEPEEFELITTYDNSTCCKPNPAYFTEIMEKIGVSPDECLMVGNDVTEDGAALKAGMSVFFLTDCLINKDNIDISDYPHGDFDALLEYINN